MILDIPSLLQLNTVPLGIVCFMLFLIFTNRKYERELASQFTTPVFLLLIVIICDNINYICTANKITGIAHVFNGVVAYDLKIIILMLLMYITLRNYHGKNKWTFSIPGIVCILITNTAIFSDLVFWYNQSTGAVERGPFGLVPHITMGLYVAQLTYIGIKKIKNKQRDEGLVIFLGSMINTAATLIEFRFKEVQGLLMGTIAIIIVFYYLYLHMEFFKIDILTGALNRISFEANNSDDNGNIKGLLIIDLNDLKVLNDKYGHSEGDNALKTIAFIMERSIPRGCYLYRIGGDEFAIVCTVFVENTLEYIREDILDSVKKTPYSCAIGYAYFDQDFDTTFNKADAMMYEHKRQIKGEGNIR